MPGYPYPPDKFRDEDTPPVPNPGSDAAITAGCSCPVLDNSHGKGYYGQPGVFVYVEGCKVHPLPTTEA